MKLSNCTVSNFGSYKWLQFNYSDLGLTLVSGVTGSGKSTLLDIPSWVLYGETAKGGLVDDVRSWNSQEVTVGILEVETQNGSISVHRTRGDAKQNDLWWQESGSKEKKRGKDLTDTQRLLDRRLGVSASAYSMSSYYNDSSISGHFFTSRAKDRRAVLEKIANLKFPILLAERVSNERKELKKHLDRNNGDYREIRGRLENSRLSLADARARGGSFQESNKRKIAELRRSSDSFEETKTQKESYILKRIEQEARLIRDLKDKQELSKDVCNECKRPFDNTNLSDSINAAIKTRQKLDFELAQLLESSNPYPIQIESEISRENPFTDQEAKLEGTIISLDSKISQISLEILTIESRMSDLSQLYDMSFETRGILLQKSVQEIEEKTNEYLEKHFDSEFRVEFKVENADDLEVYIRKNGNDCSFAQLSKGQKGLLKLCFSVAVMKTSSDRAGIHFDNLFFDEPCEGSDTELKVKAYGLFEALSTEHSSIIVIDHTQELQQLFNKRYNVTLKGDQSEISEENV